MALLSQKSFASAPQLTWREEYSAYALGNAVTDNILIHLCMHPFFWRESIVCASATSLQSFSLGLAIPVTGSERSIKLRGPLILMIFGKGLPVEEDASPSIIAHTAGRLSPAICTTKSAAAALDVRRESEVKVPITIKRFG